MKFKADEIVSVLQAEIDQFRTRLDAREVGRVLEVGDGIARIYGLSGVMSGEMVEFANGVMRAGGPWRNWPVASARARSRWVVWKRARED